MRPPDPALLLAGAEHARTRPAESAEVIERALKAAPHELEVRLAAYRFYFYTHDHAAALEQAEALLQMVARRLNIAGEISRVGLGDAAFASHDPAPGLYLQALVAIGYCAARTGAIERARVALLKAAELDPSDRFGGAWLLRQIELADADE